MRASRGDAELPVRANFCMETSRPEHRPHRKSAPATSHEIGHAENGIERERNSDSGSSAQPRPLAGNFRKALPNTADSDSSDHCLELWNDVGSHIFQVNSFFFYCLVSKVCQKSLLNDSHNTSARHTSLNGDNATYVGK